MPAHGNLSLQLVRLGCHEATVWTDATSVQVEEQMGFEGAQCWPRVHHHPAEGAVRLHGATARRLTASGRRRGRIRHVTAACGRGLRKSAKRHYTVHCKNAGQSGLSSILVTILEMTHLSLSKLSSNWTPACKDSDQVPVPKLMSHR